MGTSTIPTVLVDSGVGSDAMPSYVDSGTDASRGVLVDSGTDASSYLVDHCVGGDEEEARPLSRTWASQTDVHFKPIRGILYGNSLMLLVTMFT